MIRSMTAFARVSSAAKDGKWVVEIRSVNHRYFDFSLRLPQTLSVLEGKVKDLVHQEIKRGKVTVSITQDTGDDKVKRVSLNQDVVKNYQALSRKLQRQHGFSDGLSIAELLKLPGILSVESSELQPQVCWKQIQKVLLQALKQIRRAKVTEGSKLTKDIVQRLQTSDRSVGEIEKSAKGRSEVIYKKLKDRIDRLFEEREKDPDRLYREVAFLAERSDITEEIVRLRSHFSLFRSRMKQRTEIGRELDFLCQEMNREINTVGSKSQLFDISTQVVFIKGELEKIREQVQNIE